jgi:hypothetical protein
MPAVEPGQTWLVLWTGGRGRSCGASSCRLLPRRARRSPRSRPGGAVQAEVRGCHPGDQRRDAEPEEGDDEDGGDEPGALAGGASAIRARLTPSSASPVPTPATAVPARKAAAVVVAIAAKVAAMLASRDPRGRHHLSTSYARASSRSSIGCRPVSGRVSRPRRSRRRSSLRSCCRSWRQRA